MTASLDRVISPAADKPGVIYFLANFDAKVVKIGFATNLDLRLSSIQTGNHMDLTLIYVFRACPVSEKLLHKHFASDLLRGEWFTYTPAIDDLIEDIEAYRDNWAGADAWPEDYFVHRDETAFILATVGDNWSSPIK